jgi:hypothetical protein
MKTKILLSILMIMSLTVIATGSRSLAQTNPVFIQLGQAKGALYKPDSGPAPHVGIVVMHRESNYMNNIACREFSRRGFMVLCMNSRFENNEALVDWEQIPLDVAQGVNHLRNVQQMSKVILYGNSGGGVTMSFYQAVAENGPSYCQGPNKLIECENNLAGLPPADGIIFRDAHPGNPANGVRSINPAIGNGQRAERLNPRLDPFNPENGYNPNGPSTYSDRFKKRYFAAQADRMNKLIDDALQKLREIEDGPYPDDDAAFLIKRGDGARLLELDLSIHHSTVKPQKLLKNDGTIVTQIVESVRLADPSLADVNATFDGGTRFLTVRSFLSANAIRATDSMDGIDECSSNNSTPCALRKISVPILIGAMGAHYFIRDNEIHYEVAASPDKDFIAIEGAEHGITPCVPCEQFPGQYSNTVKNFFDYIAAWINARF